MGTLPKGHPKNIILCYQANDNVYRIQQNPSRDIIEKGLLQFV